MTGQHQQSSDETREWAALYALGALSPHEKVAFEAHLREGCPVCDAELRSFENVAGHLGFAGTPMNPPPSLHQRLFDRISSLSASTESGVAQARTGILFQQTGLLISRSVEMAWKAGGLPGIWSKPLFVDTDRQYTTALVRMDAGTVYPSHKHNDIEELYLLEGDLLVEGQVMRAGDYCRAEPGSIHSQVRTESGALFLVLSSQRDELLA